MRQVLFFIAGVALFAEDAAAESMRCGQSLISEQATVADLLKKCGEPQEKTVKTEEVRATNAAGYSYSTGETSTRELWFYQRSPQSLRMVVTIVDGVIKSIERAK